MDGAQRFFIARTRGPPAPLALTATPPMSEAPGPRIVLATATRRFGPLVAVRELDLELVPGAIHALIGENGAGKSTALKLAAGHLAPSEGRVLVDDAPLTPATPEEAIRRSIGMVHQHFMLVERMTALDNLILGAEICAGPLGRLDRAEARRRAEAIGARTGLAVDLSARVESLSVGERQRLEILRVLFRGARALLLDEPTAVLSPVEVGELYGTLRELANAGSTIAVVTHRLDEVVRFCDHVTVMRRGLGVLDQALERGDEGLDQRLTRAIMGGEVPEPAAPPELDDESPVVLRLEAARLARDGQTAPLDGVSFAVRAGEVLGIAGVEGNGQRELTRVLAGLDALSGGTLALGETVIADHALDASERVRARRATGVVVVHEDRHRDELLPDVSIADNLVLGDIPTRDDERAVAKRRFARFDVYPDDPQRLAGELSGGNQQKVVMARALDRPLKLLVLAQPTRGVDVGTARTIQHAIADAAASGTAVVIISADLAELKGLAHRIVVLRKGRVAGTFAPSASDEQIGRAMLGITGKEEVA